MVLQLQGSSAHNCALRSMPEAAELFGSVSEAYASHRPTYPESFFPAFASRCPSRQQVWDCGCGSGQASVALARQFEQVFASDASAKPLQLAPQHPRIRYAQSEASQSPLEASSVDAVLVAQAVHWFAGEAFNAEVRRVAKPGAVMAWIGYLPLELELPKLEERFEHFYGTTLKPWWSPQRRWVDQSYAGLTFPGEEWPFPADLWIERRWSLAELEGYLGSWSAVENARRSGADPVKRFVEELKGDWPGEGAQPVLVRWQFMGRWGVINS